MKFNFNTNKIYAIILFVIVCLAWGTTWIGIKFSVQSIPPLMSSALRFLVAFPIFLALAKLTNTRLKPKKQEVTFYVISTIFYFTLPYALINYGEINLSSSLSALIFSAMPIFIIIFSFFITKEQVNLWQLVGILIGMTGFYLILQNQDGDLTYRNVFSVIALFLAAIMHAGYYVYAKKVAANIPALALNTIPLGIAGVGLLLLSLLIENTNLDQITGKSVIAVIYLGLFASVIGFWAYFKLLQLVSPIVISFVFLIFPIFAILFSWFLEHSANINIDFLIYFVIILCGFAITIFYTK